MKCEKSRIKSFTGQKSVFFALTSKHRLSIYVNMRMFLLVFVYVANSMSLQAHRLFLSYRMNNHSWEKVQSIFPGKDNSHIMYFKSLNWKERKQKHLIILQ